MSTRLVTQYECDLPKCMAKTTDPAGWISMYVAVLKSDGKERSDAARKKAHYCSRVHAVKALSIAGRTVD